MCLQEVMFMVSVSAVHRTAVLLTAMLIMAGAWGFFHIPGANMLIIVFTFLSSAFLFDVPVFHERLNIALLLAAYASTAQFLISVFFRLPALQTVSSALFAFFAFCTLPDIRCGCLVMITGYLSFFAPSGFVPGFSRSIDIFVAVAVIMAVTTISSINDRKTAASFTPCSCVQSLVLAAELGIGNILFKLLQLKQGAWIMLTVLFITMSESPRSPGEKLAVERIFAVPLGIMAGGALLAVFSRMDHRFVYLVPLIAATGFFFLYNYGNFFVFSLFFIIALTVFTDWMTGTYQSFRFLDTFISRTVSSWLGAVLFLIVRWGENPRKERSL